MDKDEQAAWEAGLKECRNSKCSRHLTPVFRPDFKRCSQCNSKLKKVSWRSFKENPDMPPIVDNDAPDGHKKKDLAETTTPANTLAENWMTFKGSMDEYKAYLLKDFGIINYQQFHEWENDTRWSDLRRNSEPNWVIYQKWLITIGILPDKKRLSDFYNNRDTGPTWKPQEKDKPSDTFSVESSCIKNCPILDPNAKPIVEMDKSTFDLWVKLAGHFKTEWIAYLTGEQRPDGTWDIKDFYFPKQKATGAHVDAEDGEIKEGTIGAVHSHVNMSAFWSAEDEKHMNHPVEIVINSRGDWKASVGITLECGRPSRTDGKLMVRHIEAPEVVEDLATISNTDLVTKFYHMLHLLSEYDKEIKGRAIDALEAQLEEKKPHQLGPSSTTPITDHRRWRAN